MSIAPAHDLTETRSNPSAVDDLGQALLDDLRLISRTCRVAARTDLFKACKMLSNKRAVARDAHAYALFRCLPQAANHPMTFYRPGTTEVGFDEAWLMRAIAAKAQDDTNSFIFLIRSRILAQHQRQIAFLVSGIAAQIRQT